MSYERQLEADRLLLVGVLDRAEQIYAAILEAEPANSEAAFGLARVALERGDERLAHEHAALAVKLNPRNDDAQRLLARLTEILSARRQPPAPRQPPAVRPSEQATFARNPSMADHRRREERDAQKGKQS